MRVHPGEASLEPTPVTLQSIFQPQLTRHLSRHFQETDAAEAGEVLGHQSLVGLRPPLPPFQILPPPWKPNRLGVERTEELQLATSDTQVGGPLQAPERKRLRELPLTNYGAQGRQCVRPPVLPCGLYSGAVEPIRVWELTTSPVCEPEDDVTTLGGTSR